MKSLSTILSSLVFAFLLVAGAVVAEPPLPVLTFYHEDKAVDSRPMTKSEHTAYMKFQHAISVLDPEAATDLTAASLALAAKSLSTAVESLTGSNDKDHVSISGDVDLDALSEMVSEGGLEIGKYAERVGRAAENLKQEVARNSADLEYDQIQVGEDGDRITID